MNNAAGESSGLTPNFLYLMHEFAKASLAQRRELSAWVEALSPSTSLAYIEGTHAFVHQVCELGERFIDDRHVVFKSRLALPSSKVHDIILRHAGHEEGTYTAPAQTVCEESTIGEAVLFHVFGEPTVHDGTVNRHCPGILEYNVLAFWISPVDDIKRIVQFDQRGHGAEQVFL